LYLFVISDALLVLGILAVAAIGPRTRRRTLEMTSAATAEPLIAPADAPLATKPL
jgi:hypothetical protein